MSRAFLLQSVVFSVSFSLLAACAGSGGSTSGPLPQTGALAVGTAQRLVPSSASKPSTVKYTSLYSFKGGTDGANSYASLIDVNGTLYGTTSGNGGDGVTSNDATVFEVSASGTERVLYSFKGGTDGANSRTGLIDVDGALYGTTVSGGTSNDGTVFEVSRSGTERVIYSFKGGTADGANPSAGLTDVNGTLYGVTGGGGTNNGGAVFAVSRSGTERVIYSFKGGTDGAGPVGTLIDVNGTLYGTTGNGGSISSTGGTVFAVSTSGKESVLHSFQACCRVGTDGSFPYAGLIDVNGTLYGTTTHGGASNYGTVFAVSTSGKEGVLYSFKGGTTDGIDPNAVLIFVNGALYGTTAEGGEGGVGTVFEVSTSGKERMLYSFKGGTDGAFPDAGLIDVNGALYGTTVRGGAGCVYNSFSFGCGTVFKLTL
jgi:uncharacterized repeat protein (TIGR03803 family)